MTFCYKCPECGYRLEQPHRDPTPSHGPHVRGTNYYTTMVRDYQAEMVGIGSGVRVSRDGTESDLAALFLPDNDEFKGPGDPDGTKGMRNWHETHQPKEGAGDRSKVPGRIERKAF